MDARMALLRCVTAISEQCCTTLTHTHTRTHSTHSHSHTHSLTHTRTHLLTHTQVYKIKENNELGLVNVLKPDGVDLPMPVMGVKYLPQRKDGELGNTVVCAGLLLNSLCHNVASWGGEGGREARMKAHASFDFFFPFVSLFVDATGAIRAWHTSTGQILHSAFCLSNQSLRRTHTHTHTHTRTNTQTHAHKSKRSLAARA